jgi:signal transduction histidine kinase
MMLNRSMVIDDRLVLISAAPVSLEGEVAERPHAPVDYVAGVDILDGAELAQLGEALGLEGVAFETRRSAQRASDSWVRLAVYDGAGQRLGDLVWRNPKPGSAGFLAEVGPIMIGLLLIGAVAMLVTRYLVGAQLESIARADVALESDRMKSEFIATMSHELRTPLNAVIGYAELIQEQAQSGKVEHEELRLDASRILRAGRHLVQLINAILDHARLDAGRESFSRDEVLASDLLAEVYEVVEHLAAARGNVLDAETDADVAYVAADCLRLRQCLINLVGNAIKFTANGTIRIRAKRQRAEGRDYVVFEISDTGIGIEKAALERLFSPFVQANAEIAHQYGGSGLGLSITRKLARAMGGDVTVVSEVGRGSTFSLSVPAAHARAESLAA